MFSNNLSSIDGVSLYPIITLIIFVSLFVVLSIWIMKADKTYIEKMENIPLDKNDDLVTNPENENEI